MTETERLRAALTELRDRIKGHPAYADLTEEEEESIGGDTAELSYLARVADDALGDDGAGLAGSGVEREVRPLPERLRGESHGCSRSDELMRDAADAIERLQALAEHLRHCRECGETDVAHCTAGEPMWDVVMPQPAAEVV